MLVMGRITVDSQVSFQAGLATLPSLRVETPMDIATTPPDEVWIQMMRATTPDQDSLPPVPTTPAAHLNPENAPTVSTSTHPHSVLARSREPSGMDPSTSTRENTSDVEVGLAPTKFVIRACSPTQSTSSGVEAVYETLPRPNKRHKGDVKGNDEDVEGNEKDTWAHT